MVCLVFAAGPVRRFADRGNCHMARWEFVTVNYQKSLVWRFVEFPTRNDSPCLQLTTRETVFSGY